MKTLFTALMVCGLVSALGLGGSATAVAAGTVRAPAASAPLSGAIWLRVLESRAFSSAKRHSMAEQIHDAINRGKLSAQNEGQMALALAVLHSFDDETRFATLPLVQFARQRWPEAVQAKELGAVWKILTENFSGRTAPEEETLSGIATILDGPVMIQTMPAGFAFQRGSALFEEGRLADALGLLVRVPLDSPDYRRAKFLEALALLRLGRPAEARDALQIVVTLEPTVAEKDADISSKTTGRLRELGVLTIARILFEQGLFAEALAYYRTLTQDSYFFYESLNEQSWAFFMAGYPNRALGAIYGAVSPFFADKFNPDMFFLDATISYWLCDFDDARFKLQKFIEHSRNEGDLLQALVARTNALPPADRLTHYAKVVENYLSGVSAKNIGVGKKTLAVLMSNPALSDSHNALVSLIKERLGLQKSKEYAAGKERIVRALLAFETRMRQHLGAQVRDQMAALNADFERSLSQARLLHLEILTAKKDVLVGHGRTVQGGEFLGEERDFSDLGANLEQKWRQDKNEYWYDELGHYVFEEKSKCVSK